jgi:predicted Na+-dependent transporter
MQLKDGFSLSNVEKLYGLINKVILILILPLHTLLSSNPISTILSYIQKLVLAVLALHTGGFLLGYLLSKLSKTNEAKARAIRYYRDIHIEYS